MLPTYDFPVANKLCNFKNYIKKTQANKLVFFKRDPSNSLITILLKFLSSMTLLVVNRLITLAFYAYLVVMSLERWGEGGRFFSFFSKYTKGLQLETVSVDKPP